MQENLTTKKRGNPRRYYAMQFYDWLESVKDPDFNFGNIVSAIKNDYNISE